MYLAYYFLLVNIIGAAFTFVIIRTKVYLGQKLFLGQILYADPPLPLSFHPAFMDDAQCAVTNEK